MVHRKKCRPAEELTLIRGRRRCCICFALSGDLTEKKGQIAHLDRDPSNTTEDNLAFLCLEHHDQYDSTTSQSKSLQIGEVKTYRDQLQRHLEENGIPEVGTRPDSADQPDWDALSIKQKNALLFDRPHTCTFCGYSFSVTPRLHPGRNVLIKHARCPSCGNIDQALRLYEA